MTDLDRYLTDEAVEHSARAALWEHEWPERSWEKAPDDIRDFYISVARDSLSAVLPDIIQQAKAGALREAVSGLDEYSLHASRSPQFEHAMAWLRARADYFEQGGQP